MSQKEHVLLTTDFSEEARRAYPRVAELARRDGARVTLLHVVSLAIGVTQGALLAEPVPLPAPDREVADAREELSRELAHFAGLEVGFDVVLSENVAKGVVAYAEENGVTLIALSTHGRSGLRRMVLGSVAEAILRRTHVPVLAIPPAA